MGGTPFGGRGFLGNRLDAPVFCGTVGYPTVFSFTECSIHPLDRKGDQSDICFGDQLS
jgi:hypothetical protein